jgi:hypothetical protein
MANEIAYGHKHTLRQMGIQTGQVSMTPTANTISTINVTFPEAYSEVPDIVIVSPITTVPYSTVRYVTAANYTTTGFTLYVYRTTSVLTAVAWMAVGKLD